MYKFYSYAQNQSNKSNETAPLLQENNLEFLFSLVDCRKTKSTTLNEFKIHFAQLAAKEKALTYQGEKGDTLIMRAIKSSKGSIAKFLVHEAVNSSTLDIQNHAGETALHCAINNKWNAASTFKELLDKGARIDIANKFGNTILDLVDENTMPYHYKHYKPIAEQYQKNKSASPVKVNSDIENNETEINEVPNPELFTQSSSSSIPNQYIENNNPSNFSTPTTPMQTPEELFSQIHSFIEGSFNLYGLRNIDFMDLTGKIDPWGEE